jgi:hypothetical protein
MGLIDILMQSGNGDLLKEVQKRAGTDTKGAEDLLATLGSAMLGQVKGRAQSTNHDSSGLEDLISNSKYADVLAEPSRHYNDQSMSKNGNVLLDHITGSREGSREIATQVSKKTGVSSSIIKSLLPMLAPLIIGTLSKGMTGGSGASRGGSGLIDMLDFDHDGSVIDDVAGMAMKYLF